MARRTRRKPAPHPRKPRPSDVPATHRVSVASASDHAPTAYPRGVTHAAGASLARKLAVRMVPSTGDLGLAPVLLELAGAQHGDLRAALGVWQREQDRLVNRAWRRPGGLARPAGL